LRNTRYYEYCVTTNIRGCTTWLNAGYNSQVTVPSLQLSQTYYWQVRAKLITGATVYAKEEMWSFTVTR
jgi:hypothetical protein